MSEQAVLRLTQLPENALIDMGDFVGGMLKHLRTHPIARVTIAGGVAKMTKLAQGLLDLHSKRGAVDLQALAAFADQAGGSAALHARILAANTAAEAFTHAQAERIALGDIVAQAAQETALAVVEGRAIAIEIALFDRDGNLVGHAPFMAAHDIPPRKRRR
jgi:cobalt-precorrin-5B (C1)-methyltransferase